MDQVQARVENIALLEESVITTLYHTQNNLQDILAGLQNNDGWSYPEMVPPLSLPNGLLDRLREIEGVANRNKEMIEAIYVLLGIQGMKPAPPVPAATRGYQEALANDTRGAAGLGQMLGGLGQSLTGRGLR